MTVKADRVATTWPEQGTILRIGLENLAERWADLQALFDALRT